MNVKRMKKAALALALCLLLAATGPGARALSMFETAANGVAGSCRASLVFEVTTGWTGGTIELSSTQALIHAVTYMRSLTEGVPDSRLESSVYNYIPYRVTWTRIDDGSNRSSSVVMTEWNVTLDLDGSAKYRIEVVPEYHLQYYQQMVEASFWEVAGSSGIQACEMLESTPLTDVGGRRSDPAVRHYGADADPAVDAYEDGEHLVWLEVDAIEPRDDGSWLARVAMRDPVSLTLTDMDVRTLAVDDWIFDVEVHFIDWVDDETVSINDGELELHTWDGENWDLDAVSVDLFASGETVDYVFPADTDMWYEYFDYDTVDLEMTRCDSPYELFYGGEDVIDAYVTLDGGIVREVYRPFVYDDY